MPDETRTPPLMRALDFTLLVGAARRDATQEQWSRLRAWVPELQRILRDQTLPFDEAFAQAEAKLHEIMGEGWQPDLSEGVLFRNPSIQ